MMVVEIEHEEIVVEEDKTNNYFNLNLNLKSLQQGNSQMTRNLTKR